MGFRVFRLPIRAKGSLKMGGGIVANPQNNQTAESASHFSRLLFRKYKYND
ncbi:hypothetical protein GCWU000324_00651 [Kingella oralis ATCC 51147]|uniref:Uncharacterized protein n=1 Tax=Kingella oralis ATCC 51147 TaxID=629741 RepID=C4GEU2_9NEIS|nr:hypothetical protein GCWU000324_00651 [Kingella oralis ATCC 51147]